MSLPAHFSSPPRESAPVATPRAVPVSGKQTGGAPPRPSSQLGNRKRASVLASNASISYTPRTSAPQPRRPSTPATVPLSARGPARSSTPVSPAAGTPRPEGTPRPITPAPVATVVPTEAPVQAWSDGLAKETAATPRAATPSTTRGPHPHKDAEFLVDDSFRDADFSMLRARDIADMAKRQSRERVGFLLGRAPVTAEPPPRLKNLHARTPRALCLPSSTNQHFHSIEQIADASSFKVDGDHRRRRDRMTEWVEVMMKSANIRK